MLITISASYAAGGSVIGPQVARRLGATFVDRAIPVAVAEEMGVSVEEASALSEGTGTRWWEAFAWMSPLGGLSPVMADGHYTDERSLIRATESELHRIADEGPAVVLGHAAAIVLAERPDAVHVRLDGSVDGRVVNATEQHAIDADDAAELLAKNDKLRSGYVTHFYRHDPADPQLYDLVIDTVRLSWPRAADLIVLAAAGQTGTSRAG